MEISVVSPVYKAETIIDELVERLVKEVSKISSDFEIILVEDCGPDNSWEKIVSNSLKDKRIKGIKLARNFGQHYAITAGLNSSKGNYVVVMDCDLQDNPEYIPVMYKKAKEGYDIVYTRMKSRSHSFIRNILSKAFSLFFNSLSESSFYYTENSTYTLISRKVVNAFNQINDAHRQYLLILHWLGFKHSYVEVLHAKRFKGNSSYTFFKLIEIAVDGIISQSSKLLRLSVGLGFFISVISIVSLLIIAIAYSFYNFKEGWTSLVCLILLSVGILLISNGILGVYLGKAFDQVKNRPLYIVDETVNFK